MKWRHKKISKFSIVMGWTLPSTGMWRGEVFAISDCLVVLVPDRCVCHSLSVCLCVCVWAYACVHACACVCVCAHVCVSAWNCLEPHRMGTRKVNFIYKFWPQSGSRMHNIINILLWRSANKRTCFFQLNNFLVGDIFVGNTILNHSTFLHGHCFWWMLILLCGDIFCREQFLRVNIVMYAKLSVFGGFDNTFFVGLVPNVHVTFSRHITFG